MLKIRQLYSVEFADGVKGVLGVDERGGLYWNGEPVVTEQKVSLSRWLSFSVVVGGLSLFVIAAFTALPHLRPLLG